MPQLLRVRRCAAILDRSVSGTYDLIRRGELTTVMVGGSVRVPVDALKAYIARNTVAARTEGGDRND
jgi:excisionase family DNA binding protein